MTLNRQVLAAVVTVKGNVPPVNGTIQPSDVAVVTLFAIVAADRVTAARSVHTVATFSCSVTTTDFRVAVVALHTRARIKPWHAPAFANVTAIVRVELRAKSVVENIPTLNDSAR